MSETYSKSIKIVARDLNMEVIFQLFGANRGDQVMLLSVQQSKFKNVQLICVIMHGQEEDFELSNAHAQYWFCSSIGSRGLTSNFGYRYEEQSSTSLVSGLRFVNFHFAFSWGRRLVPHSFFSKMKFSNEFTKVYS